jgi:hypothetical protein
VVLGGAAFGVALLGVALSDEAGVLELMFGTVVLGCLLFIGRTAVRAVRGDRQQQSRARDLARVGPDALARKAVAEERVRLSADIEAVVRSSLRRIAVLAEEADRAWADDPVPVLHDIQATGQTTVTETRRMLGLLRAAQHAQGEHDEADQDGQGEPARSPRQQRIGLTDCTVATGLVALALVERFVYGELSAQAATAGSAVLTAIAAAAIVGRRTAPAVSALICAVVLVLGCCCSGR